MVHFPLKKREKMENGVSYRIIYLITSCLVSDGAGCHGEISPRPQVPAPVLLLQMRKLLEQHARTRSLEPLNDPADVLMGSIADEHVHMNRLAGTV